MEGCSDAGGVRKGAWTREEDVLLKQCIGKIGEGKWHLVPSRAGLNRCRKSCRLRWMNYLKPDIKRGEFSIDEVDLILRLHKLLGNRWSLIAGRIPGRTANDVKNYWNTHLRKKQLMISKNAKSTPTNPKTAKNADTTSLDNQNIVANFKVIKPRPWSFKKKIVSPNPRNVEPPRTASACWWEGLLDDVASDADHIVDLLTEPALEATTGNKDNNVWDSLQFGSDFWVENELKSGWPDHFLADANLWDVSEDKDPLPSS